VTSLSTMLECSATGPTRKLTIRDGYVKNHYGASESESNTRTRWYTALQPRSPEYDVPTAAVAHK